MPFLGNDVSFYVILPEGPGGLDETLRLMDADTLRLAMSDTFPFMMEVGIPKFRLEQTLSLDSILVPMGLTDLFDASVADLSAFNGVGGLSMDAATHKAFIEVNEEGNSFNPFNGLRRRMSTSISISRFRSCCCYGHGLLAHGPASRRIQSRVRSAVHLLHSRHTFR